MLNLYLHILLIRIMNVISWHFLCVAQRDLLIHSTALNNKYSPAPSDCVVRSFLCGVAVKACERRWREEVEAEEGRKYCKTTKSYLAPQTNNVGVSVMLKTLPKPIPKDNDLDTPLCQAK